MNALLSAPVDQHKTMKTETVLFVPGPVGPAALLSEIEAEARKEAAPRERAVVNLPAEGSQRP